MRNLLKRSLVIFLFLPVLGKAQGFHLGIKGGANLFKIDNQAFKEGFNYGYHLGGFAEINFSKKLGLQPEVLWSQTSYKTATNIQTLLPGSLPDLNVQLNYLQIPLLVSVKPSKLLTLQAGPQFGILIDEGKSLLQNGGNAFKTGDFSLLAGLQLNLLGLRVGGRYAVGLNNVSDVGNQSNWKNQGWQLYVGFKIF
ncbi:MAG: outer membrane beta-barrel protein [Chitinophagaceae bacterium]